MHRLLEHPHSGFQYEQVGPLSRVLPGMFALLAGKATERCDFPLGPITERWGKERAVLPQQMRMLSYLTWLGSSPNNARIACKTSMWDYLEGEWSLNAVIAARHHQNPIGYGF